MIVRRLILNFPWLLPTLIFTILVLFASQMHPLWGDEAETALFARNIVKYGVPKGWDGVNIMGINNAVVLDEDLINHTSPWAQYYLTAASFALLGESSFTARLPFILMSILSFPLMYLLFQKITRGHSIDIFGKKISYSFIALLALSLSVPYILFAYQDRYYALIQLGAIGMTLGALMLHSEVKKGFGILLVSSIGFVYGNYASFTLFAISLFLSYFAYSFLLKLNWKAIVKSSFTYLFSLLLTICLFLPWFLIFKPFESRGSIGLSPFPVPFIEFAYFWADAVRVYSMNNAFPWIFILPYLFILFRVRKNRVQLAGLLFPLLLAFLFMTLASMATVFSQVDTAFYQNRYTMLIFPFFLLSSIFLIINLYSFSKALGTIVFILYISTNIFTLYTPFVDLQQMPRTLTQIDSLRSPFVQFMFEIHNPYKTPDKEVAQYLSLYGKIGQTAFVSLDRNHEPLIFHLKDKIKFVNRVSLVNTRIFPKNRGSIPRYIYDFRDLPDWIILYSKRGKDDTFFTFDYRAPLPEWDLKTYYEEIVIPVFFSDMSRPEMDLRAFSLKTADYRDQVFIYKKK